MCGLGPQRPFLPGYSNGILKILLFHYFSTEVLKASAAEIKVFVETRISPALKGKLQFIVCQIVSA
jgi:hypothetical protein